MFHEAVRASANSAISKYEVQKVPFPQCGPLTLCEE